MSQRGPSQRIGSAGPHMLRAARRERDTRRGAASFNHGQGPRRPTWRSGTQELQRPHGRVPECRSGTARSTEHASLRGQPRGVRTRREGAATGLRPIRRRCRPCRRCHPGSGRKRDHLPRGTAHGPSTDDGPDRNAAPHPGPAPPTPRGTGDVRVLRPRIPIRLQSAASARASGRSGGRPARTRRIQDTAGPLRQLGRRHPGSRRQGSRGQRRRTHHLRCTLGSARRRPRPDRCSTPRSQRCGSAWHRRSSDRRCPSETGLLRSRPCPRGRARRSRSEGGARSCPWTRPAARSRPAPAVVHGTLPPRRVATRSARWGFRRPAGRRKVHR